MRISKAIEILELDKHCSFDGDSADLETALQLAIEALERIGHGRARGYPAYAMSQKLPSEDPE